MSCGKEGGRRGAEAMQVRRYERGGGAHMGMVRDELHKGGTLPNHRHHSIYACLAYMLASMRHPRLQIPVWLMSDVDVVNVIC